ncbi:MAG TPA: hypothetical protein VFK41_00525 [Nocardioidaceae bacterium]|nr:hypothetical protein [Nocardioidaceae bacterium]
MLTDEWRLPVALMTVVVVGLLAIFEQYAELAAAVVALAGSWWVLGIGDRHRTARKEP